MVPSHPLKDDGVPVIAEIIAYLGYFPVLNYMTTMPTTYMMDCLFILHYTGNLHLPLPQCNTY
jgi:hypothetical protein